MSENNASPSNVESRPSQELKSMALRTRKYLSAEKASSCDHKLVHVKTGPLRAGLFISTHTFAVGPAFI
jgi:hypothetical protein